MKNKTLSLSSDENSSLHQLRFYPKEPFLLAASPPAASDNSDEAASQRERYLDAAYTALNPMLQELFALSLSDFTVVRNTTIAKRRIAHGFSYQDKILLLVSHYRGELRLSIEINGSAFDCLPLDWEQLFTAVEAGYIVTDLHAKIDTLATPFCELWRCWKHESVTSSSRKKTDYDSTSKTMSFGSGARVYQIYQAGLLHGLPESGTVRHELQLSGAYARHFWELFFVDPNNLGAWIKSVISGTFDVKFRKIVNDANIARRPVLATWRTWLADTSPSYLRQPLKPTQISCSTERVIRYLLNARRSIDQVEYDYVLGQVDYLYRQSHPAEPVDFA